MAEVVEDILNQREGVIIMGLWKLVEKINSINVRGKMQRMRMMLIMDKISVGLFSDTSIFIQKGQFIP